MRMDIGDSATRASAKLSRLATDTQCRI
jgi:hypothetical protein